MKWRQHECAMRRDVFIFELIKKHGGNGYMAYNITIDVLGEAEAFEAPYITTWDYMSTETRVDVKNLKEIYNFIAGEPWRKVEITECETHIKIFCPNLIKYADEYCRKMYNKAGKNNTVSRQRPDNIPTMSGQCRDNVPTISRQYPDNIPTVSGQCRSHNTIHNNTIHNNTKTNTKKPSSTEKTPVDRVDYEAVKDLWNKTPFTTKIRDLNETRKRQIRTRLKDAAFVFPEILAEADKSDFLKGSKWFTFDWLFKNDTNWRKVLEGNYRDKPVAKPDAVPQSERLCDYFYRKFAAQTGQEYICLDKPADITRFGELLKNIGVENYMTIKNKIDAYFDTADRFIIDSGYALPLFFSKLNSLGGKND